MKKVIKGQMSVEKTLDKMSLYHPPLLPMPDIPVLNHHGAFMVKRRFDVHTGVDLFTLEDSDVYAVEYGEVVSIRWFTGTNAGTDFWENTQAIDIEGFSGTICYGEVEPIKDLKVGDMVEKGQKIAKVKKVLKEFKGKPMTMLHLAIHRHGFKYLLKDQSDGCKESFFDLQLDPTLLLIQLKNMADRMMDKNVECNGG